MFIVLSARCLVDSVDRLLDKYLYGLVRTSYKLDCEFRSVLGWLQSQIPSLEFEIINSIRVHL